MIAKILDYADRHEMLPGYGLVLVCVSGGPDSMCLLEVLRHISYDRGFDIAVVHYNHMLRGADSDKDETLVMDVCEAHGIPFYSTGSDVKSYAKRRGMGIEEAAREARYAFFYETAVNTGAVKIATAHTMNDNAETVVMNLVRGAGANGMSGIPPVRDNVIRPLLCAARDEVMEFITQRGIPYATDETNNLDIYTRNKIRRNIIPVFEELNPRFCEAAFFTSNLFRADEEFIAEIADLFINDCCTGATADAKDLAVLPFSVSSRVIRKLHGMSGLTHKHVADVLDLCNSDNPSAEISLPGMIVYREYDRIIFNAQPKEADLQFAPVYPVPGDSFIILALGLTVTCHSAVYDETKSFVNNTFTSFLFNNDDICGRISVRPRAEGDSIKLHGSNKTKTLKKLFIEKRIPVRQRSLIPVISDEKGVLAVYGIAISSRALPKHGNVAVHINFKEN